MKNANKILGLKSLRDLRYLIDYAYHSFALTRDGTRKSHIGNSRRIRELLYQSSIVDPLSNTHIYGILRNISYRGHTIEDYSFRHMMMKGLGSMVNISTKICSMKMRKLERY